jgi:peptidoglycan/LPS O-acetylase OafA/YrhL
VAFAVLLEEISTDQSHRAVERSQVMDGHPPRLHLAHLDGLRGIAILAILAIHSSQLVAGLSQPVRDLAFYGVRGVQLFFIVSGFTLTIAHAGRPIEPLNFAERRFFRIAPMFYIGVALYLLLARTTTMPLPTRDASTGDVVATLLFVHGWVPSAVNTVVPGGWSIAAEAMFYLAFPAILLLVPRPRLLAIAVMASYAVAGLTNIGLRKLGGPAGEALAFPFWLVQLPAFIGGCWLATLPPAGLRLRAIAPWTLGLATLGLAFDSQWRDHSNLLVAIVLLTLFAWSASVARPHWLQARPLVYLGQISFSFYIVHFAVLGFLRPLIVPVEAAVGANVGFATAAALTLTIAGIISAATYRWIEQPIIAATRQAGRRPR